MQFVARLTTDIVQTFEKCNPEFKYSESLNPKRFLTNPAVPVHNDGLDNANSDLILYVNQELINRKSNRRLVFSHTFFFTNYGLTLINNLSRLV
jgi:dual specificity protein kinase YAK1